MIKFKKSIILMIILIFLGLVLYLYFNISNFSSSKQLYFVHISKNAGSSIEELFKNNEIKVGKYLENTHEFQCNEWHIPPKFKKDINFKNYITFCVIRDPVDRLLSEINYLNQHSKEINDINQFVKEILNKKPNYSFDCHLLPQSDYLYDSHGNKIENILQFKNLKNDLVNFSNKYNLNIDINNLKYENQSVKKFKRSDLSPESLELIKKYYQDDFKLIN